MNRHPAAAPVAPPARRFTLRGSSFSTPARAQRGSTTGWVLGLLVLAAIGAGGWYWHEHQGSAVTSAGGAPSGGPGNRRFGGPDRSQPVSVAVARRQDIHVTSTAIGSIDAANTAVVHVQVSGTLQAIRFTEGQQVKAGMVLAQIDPRSFQASLAQVEGALARDKAQLDNARIDLARYQDLMKKDAIAKQVLDTQQALVRQLEGTVKVDQAAVDSARLQLSYTKVVAPISGRVGLKQSDLGNIVNPGDTNGIVSIVQTHPIALVFALPSPQLPQVQKKLKANEPLEVEAWDRGGKTRLAVGRIATADNAIDATTDTIKLKALFDNADDALFPNQSVSVKLRLDTLADVLAVPQVGVLRGAQGSYVYVVNDDNSVSTRVVKVGATDGEWVQVEDGAVKEGDRIVIDGVDRLRDGAKVEVIAADPAQRAGANAPPAGSNKRRRDGAASGPPDAASGAAWPASGASGARGRLPPELAEKVRGMTPDERRAAIQQYRAEHPADAASAASTASTASK